MSAAVAYHDGTTLEFIPGSTRQFTEDDIATMTAMSAAATRPLNWNLLTVFGGEGEPERIEAAPVGFRSRCYKPCHGAGSHPPSAPRVRLNFPDGVQLRRHSQLERTSFQAVAG